MRAEIIAEIGINHNGSMDLAKILIDIAKECGADVAKFQLYNPYSLLKKDDFSSENWETVLRAELPKTRVFELKKHCDQKKIEFMASAFDLERLSWLEEMEVKRHKIASRSIYDLEYIEAVQNTFKPYLVSTGMIQKDNIDPKTWRRLNSENASFLYCISKYPTPLNEIKFDCFDFAIDKNPHGYSGFSDHTEGLTAAKVAISLGAEIIEKHFTLFRRLPGPDQTSSMIPIELTTLSSFRDEVAEMNLERRYF